MKIGMNVDWDMADGWRVLVLGLSARITRNRAQSVRSELCEHRYLCFLLYTAVKIGINVQLDMANVLRLAFRILCTQSVRSEL